MEEARLLFLVLVVGGLVLAVVVAAVVVKLVVTEYRDSYYLSGYSESLTLLVNLAWKYLELSSVKQF